MKKINKKEKIDMQKIADELAREVEKYFEKHPINIPQKQNPYPPTAPVTITRQDSLLLPKCCQDCPNSYINNPFGGGVCCCSLPYQEMTRW